VLLSSRFFLPFESVKVRNISPRLPYEKLHGNQQLLNPSTRKQREWESGNDSLSFLRTLREWEGEWGIKKNFARERNFFYGIASESERQFASKNHDFFRCSSLSKIAKRFIQTMSIVLAPEFHELSVHAQHYQFVNFVVTQQNISITHDP